MKRNEIQESLERMTGTMNPCISQIARVTGHGRDYIAELLDGIPCRNDGTKKRYFVGDVAKALEMEEWK